MDKEYIINNFEKVFINTLPRHLHKVLLKCKIKSIFNQAAIQIQRHVRGYLTRKELYFIQHPKLILLVKWTFPAQTVQISGDFTENAWSDLIPLQYLKSLGYFCTTYFLENRLPAKRYYLKFIVDGNWVCNEKMDISEDLSGNLNNVLTICSEKRYVARAHSTRNLVPENLSMANISKKKHDLPRISSVEHNITRPIHLLKSGQDLDSPFRIKLCFGSFMAAHPRTRFAPLEAKGSADALFFDENLQVFGVADGVGEWETFGLDPGLFPKELMDHFKEEYQKVSGIVEGLDHDKIFVVLKDCLDKAFLKTKNFGSSTVLLALNKDNCIHTLCIGDSGYIVFRKRGRDHKLLEINRSIEQQHTFNCPYQLASFPDPEEYEMLAKQGLGSFVSLLKRSNLEVQDFPQDAHPESFTIQKGDVVIAATDGLFDNLFDPDIQKICEMFLSYDLEPKEFCMRLAKELVNRAIQKGWDSAYRSPFSVNAANYGQRYIGGKLDDTTVIVAVALEEKN